MRDTQVVCREVGKVEVVTVKVAEVGKPSYTDTQVVCREGNHTLCLTHR